MTDKRKEIKERRNIMRAFKINEISLVDHPAQEGARVAIMKRSDVSKVLPSRREGESEDAFVGRFVENDEARREFPDRNQRLAVAVNRARKSNVEKRAMLTSVEGGHSHLLILDLEDGSGPKPAGETMPALTPGEEYPHSHPWIMRDDGTVVIGVAEGHQHEAGEISTTGIEAMELIEKQETAEDGGERRRRRRNMADDAKKTAETYEAEKKDLEKRLAEAEAYGKLTDSQKAHYEKLDDSAKASFVAKSDDERANIVKAAASAAEDENPIVYTATNGTEYRKADDARLIALARESDERLAKLEKAQQFAADAALRKRAETDLANLAGSVETHMLLLKQVDAIKDDGERSEALRVLKAHNAQMAKSFIVHGYSKSADVDVDTKDGANSELEKKAKELQKADPKLSYIDAYDKASKQHPDLYAKAVSG